MKAYRILFAAALVFAPLFSQAQPQAGEGQRLTPQVMARLFPAGVVSPDYHADGSVTFRCQAPNAKVVELDCQMFPQALPMTKDGIYTAGLPKGKTDNLKSFDPFFTEKEIVKNQILDFDQFLNEVDMVVIMVKHDHIKQNWDKLKGKVILDCHNICPLEGVYHI